MAEFAEIFGNSDSENGDDFFGFEDEVFEDVSDDGEDDVVADPTIGAIGWTG